MLLVGCQRAYFIRSCVVYEPLTASDVSHVSEFSGLNASVVKIITCSHYILVTLMLHID